MAGFSVTIIVFGFFLAFVVQGADHTDGRKRHSRRSVRGVLTDTELKNSLDSIVSLLGKLNDKIDSQEQRIAVLSRQVSNINCNGGERQGNETACETHESTSSLYFTIRKTKGSLLDLPFILSTLSIN